MTTGDFNILTTERFDDRLTIFEEYANGGLNILEELLAKSNRPFLDVILDLIMEAEKGAAVAKGTEVETIARELAS